MKLGVIFVFCLKQEASLAFIYYMFYLTLNREQAQAQVPKRKALKYTESYGSLKHTVRLVPEIQDIYSFRASRGHLLFAQLVPRRSTGLNYCPPIYADVAVIAIGCFAKMGGASQSITFRTHVQ